MEMAANPLGARLSGAKSNIPGYERFLGKPIPIVRSSRGMLGSRPVGSAYANPLKSTPTVPGRLAQWLQSASAEVWVKFLLALVGLGLAFASALFSTVSRDAGNLWATVILASASLVLATLVGLVTVPYLARRVAVERLRESFDYDVTRAGIVYVLVTLVIGIAALNTGNNLLYIVVAAMLAAILVSGVVSAFVLRWLELDVRLPEHLFAGRAVIGPHCPQQSTALSALVFHSRSFYPQEEKKADPTVAVGSHNLCLSLQPALGAAVAAPARSATEAGDRAAAASGHISGHGLLSLSSAEGGGVR